MLGTFWISEVGGSGTSFGISRDSVVASQVELAYRLREHFFHDVDERLG